MEHTEQINKSINPIVAYGNKILRNACYNVASEDKKIHQLIEDLWNTLEYSEGVGLAAPQINSDQKVFVVNSKLMFDSVSGEIQKSIFSGDRGIKQVFINARIIAHTENIWTENEGCLSIPEIDEPVDRHWGIQVEYYDENFKSHKRKFLGYTAKVIQHELDHTNGILFIDRLNALKKS